MPPRYAYWTIIVDDQPTAFRASAQEDLLPTFKRLQAKHPSAKMMWWQNGKLWERRVDAQDAMHTRGELGRRGDSRQSGGGFRDRERKPFRNAERGGLPTEARSAKAGKRTAWTPRGAPSTPPAERNADNKLDWKPKGEFVPAPKRADRGDRPERSERPRSFDRDRKPAGRPEWKPKGSFDRDERPRAFKRPAYKPSGDDARSAKPEWKPKGSFDRKTEWKPRPSFDRGEKPAWKPKGSFDRDRKPEWKPRGKSVGANFSSPGGEGKPRRESEKLEWKPKGSALNLKPSTSDSAKRRWVPKEEYKKSQGIEAKRDKNWRPGGAHKDPRQKYKDAKKAKWGRFKQAIRTKWEAKGKKKNDE